MEDFSYFRDLSICTYISNSIIVCDKYCIDPWIPEHIHLLYFMEFFKFNTEYNIFNKKE